MDHNIILSFTVWPYFLRRKRAIVFHHNQILSADVIIQIQRNIIPTNPGIPQPELGGLVIGKTKTIFAEKKKMELKIKATISKTYFTVKGFTLKVSFIVKLFEGLMNKVQALIVPQNGTHL